jgi:hypothetical protein
VWWKLSDNSKHWMFEDLLCLSVSVNNF